MNVIAGGVDDLVGAAQAARAAGRFDDALACWAQVRAQFPGERTGYLGAIRTARAAGNPKLAKQLLIEALARFPNVKVFARLTERLPLAARRQVEAAAEARTRADMLAAAGPAAALAEALTPTKVRKPTRAALRQALRQVEALESAFPMRSDVRAACLHLLRALHLLPDARARGEAWLAEQPGESNLALALADVLDDDNDLTGARMVLAALRSRLGSVPAVEAKFVSVLARLDDPQAAAVCAQAMAAHPRSPLVLREYATLAQRAGHWEEALRRWDSAVEICPGNAKLTLGRAGCRLQLTVREATDESEMAAFFNRFESLGGTLGGCEFGMVQRKYGSAALGLLRWSNIRAEDLIAGLQQNFAGLGTLENTELTRHRVNADREEYFVRDTTFNFGSHTFISTKDATPEKMLVQAARRFAFLKDALLDHLQRGERIFVYKFLQMPDDAETLMHAILAGLRRHGPGTLLCAVPETGAAGRGTVRKLREGLYVGVIGRFMGNGLTQESEFDELAWRCICAATCADLERSRL